MPEIVESGQTEFDEHHQAKVGSATDILQASVSRDPNATVNFGVSQVSTQLFEHLQQVQAPLSAANAPTERSSMVT